MGDSVTQPLPPLEEFTAPRLTIEIKNQRPVELVDLTESFLSLGEEYKRFVSAHPEFKDTAGVKLYVKEIRTGSIVTELITLAGIGVAVALPYVVHANHLVQFAKHLKSAYDYVLGRTPEPPPQELESADYKLLSTFIEPIAKDQGSQINITATEGANVTVNFTVNSTEANAAQNVMGRHIAELKEPEKRLHEKVLLYWNQARPDLQKQVGDRATIESISASSVKTIFADDALKMQIILGDPNPFLSAYIVDVFVETIRGKPALYKILAVYERIDREPPLLGE